MFNKRARKNSRNTRSNTNDNRKHYDVTPRHRKRKLKLLPVIVTSLILCFLVGTIVVLAMVASIAKNLPQWSPEDLEPDQTSFLYDAHGDLYTELHSSQNRTSVALNEMPQYLIDAFLATEDTRFYDHFGIDVVRVAGAVVADIKSASLSQGASTVTMQLARSSILKNQEREWKRKIQEALIAIQIERRYTKDEILYYYLNAIYFGGNYYGVQAASQAFFGKDVQDITLSEAAVLVGTIRNAGLYSPLYRPENSLKVRNQVLDNLAEYKPAYQQQVATAKAEQLVVKESKSVLSYRFPWFTDYVIDQTEDILQSLKLDTSLIYTGGLHIYTTLDPLVQQGMEDAFSSASNFPSSSTANPVQCGMVVMDPHTGGIKGLMGGREYTTRRGLNRAAAITRQPGSVFKPIAVYGPAVENGYYPASVVNDVPTNFGTTSQPYTPTNYDGRYRGLVTMRAAIKDSLNVPAVKFMQKIGVSTAIPYIEKMGITLNKKSDTNLAIALGGLTNGVSPLQVAGAYATYANAGVYTQPYVITRITDRNGVEIYANKIKQQVVFSQETAYLITDMLETVVNSGTGTNAKMNRPVAGKTGTVELPDTAAFKGKTGNKDAWWAAYTPEMVGVVWMGYDEDMDASGNAQYLKQIYGGKYPALLWKKVITAGSVNLPVQDFTKPNTITSLQIDTKSGLLPSSLTPSEYVKTELFNKTNVPKEQSNIWKMVQICPVSGQLAGPYCPQTINQIKIPWPTDSNGNPISIDSKVEDRSLYILPTVCTVHNSSTSLPENPTDTDGSEQPTTTSSTSEATASSVMQMPANLTAVVNKTDTGYQVKLTWEDKNNRSDTLYIVERDINGTKSTMRTYYTNINDSKVTAGSTYTYRVQAASDAGKGDKSAWTKSVTVVVP